MQTGNDELEKKNPEKDLKVPEVYQRATGQGVHSSVIKTGTNLAKNKNISP